MKEKIISNYFSGSDHIGLCCERDITACRTFSKQHPEFDEGYNDNSNNKRVYGFKVVTENT